MFLVNMEIEVNVVHNTIQEHAMAQVSCLLAGSALNPYWVI